MKRLRRMLLVNWHYIVHEVIEFAPVTFLTGKNAAGKSTIIDALQLVVLGDTTGHYFNKAANEQSRRTLRGYLRGEVAEEDDRVVCLREGEFSSYVVLEFVEGEGSKQKAFCFGAVFDCHPDATYDARFFYLNEPLPDFHFIRDGVPLDIQGLKQWGGQRRGRFEMYESNKSYQQTFLARMGNLREKFFRLFRKAVPFTPIMDISGFISDFVCDVKPDLDIADMRENIRHYRRLEEELRVVEARVKALEEMEQTFGLLEAAEQKVRLYDYLCQRAELDQRERAVAALRDAIARAWEELAAAEAALTATAAERDEVRGRRDALIQERAQSDVYQRQQQLEQHKRLLETQFAQIRRDGERLDRWLVDHGARWRQVAERLQAARSWFPGAAETAAAGAAAAGAAAAGLADAAGAAAADEGRALLPERPLVRCGERMAEALAAVQRGLSAWPRAAGWAQHQLLDREVPAVPDPEVLAAAAASLQEAAAGLAEAQRLLRDVVEAWEREVQDLERAIAELRRGIKQYNPKVLALRDVLRDHLRASAGVHIFADLLDIRDPSWQPAIEGYLHTQRFYLLVPPAHFGTALRIYDEVKQAQAIHDVGLVDIEKVMAERPVCQPGSLAEEVVTDDPYARAYADYLLGRVMKCDHVDDLRRHRTAITRDGMLYQNYVARQLNPERWATLFIGKRAVEQQLAQKLRRLEQVQASLRAWRPRLAELAEWARQPAPAASELLAAREFAQGVGELDGLRRAYRDVLAQLGQLDLARLSEIEEEIRRCDARLVQLERKLDELRDQRGRLSAQRDRLASVELPQAEAAVAAQRQAIAAAFDPAFAAQTGEPRYQQELARLKSPDTIQVNFGRQQAVERNRAEEHWSNLLRQREAYNRTFGAGFDIQRRDHEAYRKELQWLKDTQLTEYAQHIAEAKRRAEIQFQEDFINKLRSHIETVDQQIRELNHALRDISFGGRERYEFKVSPNPQYERFYRMIMDEMLLEGRSLFSQAFLDKHGEVIEELFRHIVDVDERDPAVQTELEQNLKKFTDYRTYLDFDLIVRDEEGRQSRLSRVMAKRSGGETQTPFYIAVLASFAQLYRVHQPGFDNTLRLIVFDEAYSKMDHQRIRDSIRLARDLKLQVVLAAPTEKIADIVPCVDRTVVVQRIKSETRVAPFEVLAREESGVAR